MGRVARDVLKARNTSFVFTTGYSGEATADKHRVFPRCEKPFNQSVIIAALSAVKRQAA